MPWLLSTTRSITSRIDRLPVARPAAAGVELRARLEQRRAAADAVVAAGLEVVPVFAGERALGGGVARHLVLHRVELLAPLRVGLLHFVVAHDEHDTSMRLCPFGREVGVRLVLGLLVERALEDLQQPPRLVEVAAARVADRDLDQVVAQHEFRVDAIHARGALGIDARFALQALRVARSPCIEGVAVDEHVAHDARCRRRSPLRNAASRRNAIVKSARSAAISLSSPSISSRSSASAVARPSLADMRASSACGNTLLYGSSAASAASLASSPCPINGNSACASACRFQNAMFGWRA